MTSHCHVTEPTLYYWNAPGLAEPIRRAFYFAEITFGDVRFSADDWPRYKEMSPTGYSPFLKLPDGTVICESMAIMSYVCQLGNLIPGDAIRRAQVFQIYSFAYDVYQIGKRLHKCPEDEKEKLMKGITTTELPNFFSVLDAMVSKTQGPSGFCIGEEVSMADFIIPWALETVDKWCEMYNLSADFACPHLKKVKSALENHPRMMKYYASRNK